MVCNIDSSIHFKSIIQKKMINNDHFMNHDSSSNTSQNQNNGINATSKSNYTNRFNTTKKECNMQEWPIPLSDEIMKKKIPLLTSSDKEITSNVNTSHEIIIRVITWNQQARKPPPPNIIEKYLTQNGRYHIIAFGTEECEKSFLMSAINPSKVKWESSLDLAVGSDYRRIRSHALQATHLIVYAHRAVAHLISNIESTAVGTGYGNKMGNKGGVGISFSVGFSSFCFINVHLAAHQHEIKRRTTEFTKISTKIARRLFVKSRCSGSKKNVVSDDYETDFSIPHVRKKRQIISSRRSPKIGINAMKNPLIDKFDFVFWAGDMNFRVNGTRDIVDNLLRFNMHDVLMHNDQLNMLMKFNTSFSQFSEGPLNFRPTYKFRRGSDIYDPSKKQRIPSWTDRILFKTESDVNLLSYSSATEIRTSDHRPVYATFRVKIRPFLESNPIKIYLWQQQPISESQVCTIS